MYRLQLSKLFNYLNTPRAHCPMSLDKQKYENSSPASVLSKCTPHDQITLMVQSMQNPS